jgi:hypothetical protein
MNNYSGGVIRHLFYVLGYGSFILGKRGDGSRVTYGVKYTTTPKLRHTTQSD